MVNSVINLGLRGAQLVFGAVVLGLSVTLIKGQKNNAMPATFGYAAFCGGIAMVGASIGIAATWIELLQSIILLGVDAVVGIFQIAGGIVIAYKLRGLNCADGGDESLFKKFKNELINGGCVNTNGGLRCGYEDKDGLNSRCKQNQADSVFMFLTVIILIASVAVTFIQLKKR